MPRKFPLVLAVLAATTAACGGNGVAASSRGSRPAAALSAGSPPASATPSPAPSTFPPEVYGDGFSRHPHPKAEITAALARSGIDKRPILLDFSADWCPNCKVVEHEFRAKDVHRVLAGYHVVTVDVGRFNRNMDVARRYRLDLNATGIPALLILQPDGRRRAEIDGRPFPNDPGIPTRALAAWLKRYAAQDEPTAAPSAMGRALRPARG
ncbi:thioredoxin family protein [Actinoallomurus soli]|uniref:thioredoxin family protein n=1 Tax=Actinoallomurus soli TaxID=2952535 RepID=UPI0020932F40|nr:thioredoxin family protein [Actinoallomurus soli]MCO5968961.1 thioredoxin family protein [Actinoallomurus soli]